MISLALLYRGVNILIWIIFYFNVIIENTQASNAWFILMLGSWFIGLSKSGLMPGLGLLAIPLWSAYMHPLKAAAIVLPQLWVMDMVLVIRYWHTWRRDMLRWLLPQGLLGVVLAWVILGKISVSALMWFLGLLCICYGIQGIWQWSYPEREHMPIYQYSYWSIGAGFASFIGQAGGPFIKLYLLPRAMKKSVYLGTTGVYFFFINGAKLIPYAHLGMMDLSTATLSMMLLPVAVLGILMGSCMLNFFNENIFYRINYLSLLFTGTKIIIDEWLNRPL